MRWYAFFEPSQVKTPLSPYSKEFENSRVFEDKYEKKSPEEFGDENRM